MSTPPMILAALDQTVNVKTDSGTIDYFCHVRNVAIAGTTKTPFRKKRREIISEFMRSEFSLAYPEA